jgi:peptidoglycan/xylan/chitin deacetylase (PgdA/CDA1 family)
MIRQSIKVIREFTGKRPVGWMGPGLTETLDSPDQLAAAGIKYIADWVIDDEPCAIRTRGGELVTLPYSLELNDIAMMVVQHHAAAEFATRTMDYFERVYQEGRERAKIMAIAVHPYISGVPHRIKYFETVLRRLRKQKGVLFWNGAQILDWFLKARARQR